MNIISNNKSAKLITISIPVYNEALNIERLLVRLDAVASVERKYRFEFLFTDNRSTDETFSLLSAAAMNDSRIRVLRLSRNFGFQRSILANYLEARGDAAIQLDADLQDPPELISEFLRHWEKGYSVVFGIRNRRTEGRLAIGARRLFYKLIAYLSEVPVPIDAGDFRLIDRKIIEHLRGCDDQNPYIRGMIASLGYAQVGIPYSRDLAYRCCRCAARLYDARDAHANFHRTERVFSRNSWGISRKSVPERPQYAALYCG